MRRVQSDSGCEHNDHGYHIWMVYAHDKMWNVLDCTCARCGSVSRMTNDTYLALLEVRERAWAERHRPIPFPRSGIES